jgi:hypothetical protein
MELGGNDPLYEGIIMAEIGRTGIGRNRHVVEVNADPRTTAVDALAGSLVIHGDLVYRKLTSGSNTDVSLASKGDAVKYFDQTGHSFVVGDVIRPTATPSTWTKSQANTALNAEVGGLVVDVPSADRFGVQSDGFVTGLTGLTAGDVYYLSEVTAGLLTNVAPTTAGTIKKSVLYADTTTSGRLLQLLGQVIPTAQPAGNVSGRPRGGGAGPPISLTSAQQRDIVGMVILNSGTTIVAVSSTVTLATVSGLVNGETVHASVRLRDAVADFGVFQGDASTDPASNRAVHMFANTAVANEHALRIRQKDGGSASRTFDWIIYKNEVTL